MSDIDTLIQNARDGELQAATNIFNELMAARINDALDAEKIKMADIAFNGATEADYEADEDTEAELEDAEELLDGEDEEGAEDSDEDDTEDSDEEELEDEDEDEEDE